VIDLQLEVESGFDVIQTVRSKFGPNSIILVVLGSKDIESIDSGLGFLLEKRRKLIISV
jgi:ActR/RegA family two-component response regulator